MTVDKAEKVALMGLITEIELTELNSNSDSLERQAFFNKNPFMVKTIYKLQIWLDGNENTGEKPEFRDMYFDVSRITGFYIPNDDPELEGEKAINIFFDGDFMTIKQEPHIIDFLTKNFVKVSVVNEQ